ncbi:alpha/beta hydrolase [Acidithiobacillus sp.]
MTIRIIEVLAGSIALLAMLDALAPWFLRRAFRAPRMIEKGTPARFDLPYQELSIATERGKRLFAWYIPAPQQIISTPLPVPAIAVVHGWGGNAELMLPFAPILHRAGYALFLFDARNHGKSDADDFSSMPKFAEDLEHAIRWLEARPDIAQGKIAVLGHSLGAAAALLVASRRRVAAVVSIGTFAHPVTVMRRLMAAHHIPYWPVGRWVLKAVERQIGVHFADIAPITTIQQAMCPVLLVHGEDDAQVPLADAQAIYAHRKSEQVQLWVLPNVSHNSAHKIEDYGVPLVAFLQDVFA